MIRARRYRLYPTPDQAERLSQWVGAVRFTYNLALEQRLTFGRRGRTINAFTQCSEVTALRQEVDWLRDVPREALGAALNDLDHAFKSWWSGRSGRPTMRRRGLNDRMRFKHNGAHLRRLSRRGGVLSLPKMPDIPMRWTGLLDGGVRHLTICRSADKWYVAVAFRLDLEAPEPSALPSVGIDRGITVFAALSDGQLIEGPNVGRRAAVALARAQRSLARKRRGSQNRNKAARKVARLHARVGAARKDFLHKTSTAIAKTHGLVVLEDLRVRNMTASAAGTVESPGRNVRAKAGLNRAILDQGWSAFGRMLAYKLEERGGTLLSVNPANTSRTCSACGVIDADSRSGIRFSCRACGHTAHADTNAAINILRRGAPMMPVEVALAAGEAGTSPGDRASPAMGGCRLTPTGGPEQSND